MRDSTYRKTPASTASPDEEAFKFSPARLPYRILLLGKMIDRVTAHSVRNTAQLSLAEWRVLGHVGMIGECTAAHVMRVAYSDRAEVSRAIGSLEKRGLIRRDTNPRNRKSRLVSLTAEGQAIHDAICGERTMFYQHWLADLSAADLALIDAGLDSITKRVIASAPELFDL